MASDLVRDAIAAGLAELQAAVRFPVPPLGYGIDLVCQDDLTADLAETDPAGFQALAQDCYHRVTTDRGTLPDDPDYGINLAGLLSRGLTDAEITRAQQTAESEIKKDDRVAGAAVTITEGAAGLFSITILIEPADPAVSDFRLIATVQDSVSLLQQIEGSP